MVNKVENPFKNFYKSITVGIILLIFSFAIIPFLGFMQNIDKVEGDTNLTISGDGYIHIYNEEQLRAFADAVNTKKTIGDFLATSSSIKVRLKTNISYTGYPIGWSEEYSFQGTFDGNGYTISCNLIPFYCMYNTDVIGAVRSLALGENFGLFGYTNGATITNLNLKLEKIFNYTKTSSGTYSRTFANTYALGHTSLAGPGVHRYFDIGYQGESSLLGNVLGIKDAVYNYGTLVGYAKNTKISNINVQKFSDQDTSLNFLSTIENTASHYRNSIYVGGLVGRGEGDESYIKNCSIESLGIEEQKPYVALDEDWSKKLYRDCKCSCFIGGIAGKFEGEINNVKIGKFTYYSNDHQANGDTVCTG